MALRQILSRAIKPLKTLTLKGTIAKGTCQGTRYTTLPWVKRQIHQKLGFTPHPGTLNIKLSSEERTKLERLKKAKSVVIEPETGFYSGTCYKALLMDKAECTIVIPQVPNYPKNLVEIIASTNLRQKLNLKDGDTVKIEIAPE